MSNELITRNDETVRAFLSGLDTMLTEVENLTKGCKPLLDGEHYLTDKEMSQVLKLSRRTLQDYRNGGRIPYIQLGGKILYRESDVERVLREGYREAYRCRD